MPNQLGTEAVSGSLHMKRSRLRSHLAESVSLLRLMEDRVPARLIKHHQLNIFAGRRRRRGSGGEALLGEITLACG